MILKDPYYILNIYILFWIAFINADNLKMFLVQLVQQFFLIPFILLKSGPFWLHFWE